MDLIDQFIARYRKEYDFYDQAARLAAEMLEAKLQSAGIRAIVTSRAKSVTRLEGKVRQRAAKKNYKSVEDIFEDIVDLAGVRVAIYFPGERDQVGKVITQLFAVQGTPKGFPGQPAKAPYKKRFSGYGATHYRVTHLAAALSEGQTRYALAKIEIQVASVLMHAWAEVEHDLVYKPEQGPLSEDEYAILDELNGMVMAGEIALERLQRAGKQRVAERGRRFANHYDLADYLLDHAGPILNRDDPDAQLGRINVLYKLLDRLNRATPDALQPYVDGLTVDFDRRPLADQIIDQILSENPADYDLYQELRRATLDGGRPRDTEAGERDHAREQALGAFIGKWIDFEREIRRRAGVQGPRPWLVPTAKTIEGLQIFHPNMQAQLERVRRFRNNVVHGIEAPPIEDIDDASHILDDALVLLRSHP
jgi:ppGpp synthetase/RelA/SpoT-type nucleotidyltranferase